MAQFSGFWTTGGATGDQVAGYTQAHWSTAGSIFAACSGFEGVAPGWEGTAEFLTTDAGGGNLSVGTGAAMVDGKWFENDAAVTVNIPTPAAGKERIDRIVARTVWANFTVRITRIVGTAAAIPVAPAITQTSGATYDIPLYQVRITDGGVITLTDERVFAGAQVDGVTLENAAGVLRVIDGGIDTLQLADNAVTSAKILADSVDTLQLADDSVTTDKAGPTLIALTHRQGGSALQHRFGAAGVTNVPVTVKVLMQVGVFTRALGAPAASGSETITLPTAYISAPFILIQQSYDDLSGKYLLVNIDPTLTSGAAITFNWATADGGNVSNIYIAWLTLGQLS